MAYLLPELHILPQHKCHCSSLHRYEPEIGTQSMYEGVGKGDKCL